ncbi:HEAT repeat domain-containing protein [bacterium]|nr:HEAT repeat domain-containing protein [candidate division CSSED10-310 bacterium]
MANIDRELWQSYKDQLESKDRDVKLSVLSELASRDEIQAIRLLLTALSDLSAAIREKAAEILKEKDHPAVVPGLISLLDTEALHVKTAAVNTLKTMPPEKTYDHLINLVKDPSTEHSLRIAVLPLLARSNDEDLKHLFSRYLSENDEQIKWAALDGICHSEASWTEDLLIDLLNSTYRETREKTIEALRNRTLSEHAIDHLIETLKMPGTAGQSAMEVLAGQETAEYAERMIPLLDSSDKDVRYRALMVMGMINPQLAAISSVQLLADKSEMVRNRAAEILKDINQEGIIELLDSAFPGESPTFAETAAQFLAKIGDEQAKAILERAFESNEPAIYRSVLKGVAKIPSAFSIDFLKSHRSEKTVQSLVVTLIAEYQSKLACKALVEIMSDPSCYDTARNALLTFPADKLETYALALLKEASAQDSMHVITILGQLGSHSALEHLSVTDDDHPHLGKIHQATGEIVLRHQLAKKGYVTSGKDIVALEEEAISAGWQISDDPLSILLVRLGKNHWLKSREKLLDADLRRTTLQISSLEDELTSARDIGSQGKTTGILKFVLMLLLLASVFGVFYSFYKNWTDPSGLWYGLLVVFTITSGTLFFSINRQNRRKRFSPNISIKHSPVELEKKINMIREKSEKITLKLEHVREEMKKNPEHELISVLEALIESLTGKPR